MEKYLFQNESQSERLRLLKDNCDVVEMKSYMRKFTQDELAQMKDELADESIQLNDIKVEKKEVMNEFKQRIKPHEKNIKTLLSNLRHKAEFVEEECYKFIDIEDKMIGYYNAQGELIESRPARQNELSKNIFAMDIKKTGTNN